MAESQLKKLEVEKERLQAELKTLREAISTREASNDLIAHVEAKEEPFSTANQATNPWVHPATAPSKCCVIM
jgi:hypothetical protein